MYHVECEGPALVIPHIFPEAPKWVAMWSAMALLSLFKRRPCRRYMMPAGPASITAEAKASALHIKALLNKVT